ncbi:MAG TPA: DegV family protein [Anaerolineales bacterium]|nr:DegV family protein [Anaerolineales bacterium]
MRPVMVLTDSTAYLPPEFVTRYPIHVVPLTVNWDGHSYRDGIDIQPDEFYRRLAASNSMPSTSQVSVGDMSAKIEELLAGGNDVLLLPISSGISSTYQTAESAMMNFPQERVALLDTKLVAMALSFQVLAAARAAAAGADLLECKRVAQEAYKNIGVVFAVDTLKYLAAGGRINSAKRLLGAALKIKPILEIRDGKIELVCSVSTRRKAIERMFDLVERGIGGRTPVRISVFHAMEREAAVELLEAAKGRFSPIESILSEVSPVIGVHVGPGTLSVAYHCGE